MTTPTATASRSGAWRKNTPARTWSALYQQRPAPEDGDYFKAEWLRPYDKAPAPKRCGSMAALTTLSPRTEAITPSTPLSGSILKAAMYLLDLWRKQAASDVWVEAFCDLVKQWKPIGWAEEQGRSSQALGRSWRSGSVSARPMSTRAIPDPRRQGS
jgi:hypothetical protein